MEMSRCGEFIDVLIGDQMIDELLIGREVKVAVGTNRNL